MSSQPLLDQTLWGLEWLLVHKLKSIFIDPTDLIVQLDRSIYAVEEGRCFNPSIRVITPDLDDDGDYGLVEFLFNVFANVFPGDGKNGAGMSS